MKIYAEGFFCVSKFSKHLHQQHQWHVICVDKLYQVWLYKLGFLRFSSVQKHTLYLTKLTHTAIISAIIVVVVTAKVAQALTAIDKQKSYFLVETKCNVYI